MADRSQEQWRDWVQSKLEEGADPATVEEQLIAEGWGVQQAEQFVDHLHDTEEGRNKTSSTAKQQIIPSPQTIIKGVKIGSILLGSSLAFLGLFAGGLAISRLAIVLASLLYFAILGYTLIKGKLLSWGAMVSAFGLIVVGLFVGIPILVIALIGAL